jgi:hypothetical protein
MGAPGKQPKAAAKQQRGAGVPEGLDELHAAQQLTKYNLGRPLALKTLAKDQKQNSRDTLLQERLVQEHFSRFNPPEPEVRAN